MPYVYDIYRFLPDLSSLATTCFQSVVFSFYQCKYSTKIYFDQITKLSGVRMAHHVMQAFICCCKFIYLSDIAFLPVEVNKMIVQMKRMIIKSKKDGKNENTF